MYKSVQNKQNVIKLHFPGLCVTNKILQCMNLELIFGKEFHKHLIAYKLFRKTV